MHNISQVSYPGVRSRSNLNARKNKYKNKNEVEVDLVNTVYPVARPSTLIIPKYLILAPSRVGHYHPRGRSVSRD